MAVFNCKSCGGDLEIQEGTTVVTCEYCGRQQTVPSADSEKKVNLFNRANRLRSKCEFDKAAGVYESIVAEFPTESEAYWGLCLCKFGIEYVDDPATSAKIPTCHRTSYESIFDDSNFDLACENADALAVSVYRNEAKEIDRLQKEILAIAKNEQPFDVFICYKESDELGGRTVDSELAHDIYDVLTENGYKVFYSRITLKAKLGQDYEPYIFSALNSAKVMLAIGTKFEYYNAVWVKNEWSRFLALMKKDPSKKLIPCYRDIDAYDLPKEFGNLQGQDLSSPRAFQDLMTNIARIIPKHNTAAAVSTVSDPAVENILKRAYISLEDGDWDTANKMCEKVLDADAENAQAYLIKLCIDYKLRKPSELGDLKAPIDGNNSNYQKVLRFGDKAMNEEMEGYRKRIIENTQVAILKQKFERGGNIFYYRNLMEEIGKYSEFKSANDLLERCREMIYNVSQQALKASNYDLAMDGFKSLPGYKDADEWVKACCDKKGDEKYESLVKQFNQGGNITDYRILMEDFDKISDYKDAKDWAEKCREKIYEKAKLAFEANNFDLAEQGFKEIRGYKDVEKYAKILEISDDPADDDTYTIRSESSSPNNASPKPAAESVKPEVSAVKSNQSAAIDILTQGTSVQSENERIERIKESKVRAVVLSLMAVVALIIGIAIIINVHKTTMEHKTDVASEMEIAEENIGEIVEIFNTPVNELKKWNNTTVTYEGGYYFNMSYLDSDGKEYTMAVHYAWDKKDFANFLYDEPPSRLEVPIEMLISGKSEYSYLNIKEIFGDGYETTINGVNVHFYYPDSYSEDTPCNKFYLERSDNETASLNESSNSSSSYSPAYSATDPIVDTDLLFKLLSATAYDIISWDEIIDWEMDADGTFSSFTYYDPSEGRRYRLEYILYDSTTDIPILITDFPIGLFIRGKESYTLSDLKALFGSDLDTENYFDHREPSVTINGATIKFLGGDDDITSCRVECYSGLTNPIPMSSKPQYNTPTTTTADDLKAKIKENSYEIINNIIYARFGDLFDQATSIQGYTLHSDPEYDYYYRLDYLASNGKRYFISAFPNYDIADPNEASPVRVDVPIEMLLPGKSKYTFSELKSVFESEFYEPPYIVIIEPGLTVEFFSSDYDNGLFSECHFRSYT